MAGHVYLIGSRRYGWYKIGKSSNAAIRVSQLGILLPFRIEVIAIWKAENHHELERVLHEKYSLHRINGEWFGFSKRQVRQLTAELKMAAVPVLENYSNVVEDPPRRKASKKIRPYFSPAEREARKQKAITERAARKLLTAEPI